MKTVLRWTLRALGVLFAVLLIALFAAAFIPIPQDDLPEVYGAGATSLQPSGTGLRRAFPPINEPDDNPSTPRKVELGRLLFFDPILSGSNDISCASCHHPDFGLADGLPRAAGFGGSGAGPERSGGVALARNTMSLWNVAYSYNLFWDGRAGTLEEQSLVPLTHADEMGGADTVVMLAELNAIPEYVDLFEGAFGDGVSLENVQRALAAFERSLVSDDAPFDRYAADNLEALSPAQLRGLALFRSAALRCFECHVSGTFGSDTFRITGVPDVDGFPHDAGRAAVAADAGDGAFKVPTLRNIVLTAPYMHNGVFSTLEEVIDFYSRGAGRQFGNESVDPLVRPFELDAQQQADLIAFLTALTDESGLPQIPEAVPSGLPVVAHIDNPVRDLVAEHNIETAGETLESTEPKEILVNPGDSIQAAVDEARPGDTVLINFGTYHERIVVNLNSITILGVPNAAGEYPTLDGQNELTEAVISSGNDFEIGYLAIQNYTDNGVIVEGVTGVYIHHIYAKNTGTYGLYPVQSTEVLIEYSEVIGANDAGIYAGQSADVIVRYNEVHENVLGIELENTINGEVYGNHTYGNTCGILIVLLPHLESKVSLHTRVYDNVIENNNHENFAKAGTAAAIVPPGSGLALIASDHVEVYGNTIRGNQTAGVGIFSLTIAFDESEIDIGPRPEHISVHDNEFSGNGLQPDAFLTELGIPGADILWDVSGTEVHFDEAKSATLFPPVVPSSSWPDLAYNLYWQVFNFIIGLVS